MFQCFCPHNESQLDSTIHFIIWTNTGLEQHFKNGEYLTRKYYFSDYT